MAHLFVAVEGIGDAAMATRIVQFTGHELAAAPFITGGKLRFDQRISGYNAAALHAPWLALRDLDSDAPCPGALVSQLVPARNPNMMLRIPVTTAESWILADRVGIADYLGLSVAQIPKQPERLRRPKRALVDLARKSPRRQIREDMVPDPSVSAEVGAGYTSRLIDFTSNRWDIAEAAALSSSLNRCLSALSRVL